MLRMQRVGAQPPWCALVPPNSVAICSISHSHCSYLPHPFLPGSARAQSVELKPGTLCTPIKSLGIFKNKKLRGRLKAALPKDTVELMEVITKRSLKVKVLTRDNAIAYVKVKAFKKRCRLTPHTAPDAQPVTGPADSETAAKPKEALSAQPSTDVTQSSVVQPLVTEPTGPKPDETLPAPTLDAPSQDPSSDALQEATKPSPETLDSDSGVVIGTPAPELGSLSPLPPTEPTETATVAPTIPEEPSALPQPAEIKSIESTTAQAPTPKPPETVEVKPMNLQVGPHRQWTTGCVIPIGLSDDAVSQYAMSSLATHPFRSSSATPFSVIASELQARSQGRFEVMSKGDLRRLISRQEEALMMGCNDSSCLMDLASFAEADNLITASVNKLGERSILTIELLDAKLQTVLRRQAIAWRGDPSGLVELARACLAWIIEGPEASKLRGNLQVVADQDEAAVYINGKSQGETPMDLFPDLTIGLHEVRINKDGFVAFDAPVVVNPGETTLLQATLIDESTLRPWYMSWWVWSGATVLVGGATTAIVMTQGYGGSIPLCLSDCERDPWYTTPTGITGIALGALTLSGSAWLAWNWDDVLASFHRLRRRKLGFTMRGNSAHQPTNGKRWKRDSLRPLQFILSLTLLTVLGCQKTSTIPPDSRSTQS